jgi:glycosyltransferase involved in cell wall biosynthesis
MSHSSPAITVILPFFNAQNTLGEALMSIQKQTHCDFECIMINNNSSDQSCKIARYFEESDARFHLIHEDRQGVVYASNAGSKLTRSKYTARMDADDEALPDRLKLQYHYLENNQNTHAVGGLVKYRGYQKNTEGFARYVDWSNSLKHHEEIYNRCFIESPIINPTAMWRTELAENYGLYKSGDFPEDYEMWLRWLENDLVIEKVNDYVLKWYDSDKRLTRTHSAYTEEAFYRIKTQYLVRRLKKINNHFPEVYIWGASKRSRQRADLLNQHGISIRAYIDTKTSRQLVGAHVIYYKNLPKKENAFILVYMGLDHARKKICDFLQSKGYKEGKNFILVS